MPWRKGLAAGGLPGRGAGPACPWGGGGVRDSAGLAYSAYSSIGAGPGPEPWEFVAGVNPENVERAIHLIRREIGKFVSHRVTLEELSDNQANFIGRLPLQPRSK